MTTTTHPPGAVAVFFKENAVFLTGAVAFIITIATMQADVEALKKDVGDNTQQIADRVEPLAKEVQAIRTEQAVMSEKLGNMETVQKERYEDTKDVLARILEKVD